MDKIQRFLVKEGRKDLAQAYYLKFAKAKKDDATNQAYVKLLGKIRNLKSQKAVDKLRDDLKNSLEKTFNSFSSDKKKIINRELAKKEKSFKN